MMPFLLWLTAVPATLVLSSGAQGQITPTPRYSAGVYAGGTIPLGEFADSTKAGYHVGGMVDRALNNVLEIRIDAVFNKLSDKTLSEGTTFREVGTNLLFGTLSAKVHPVRDTISPYLLAGVGIYRFRFDFVCRGVACTGPEREGESATNLGFNAGAGASVRVRHFRPFLQAGYHAILPKAGQHGHDALILVSLGLMLR